MWSLGGEAGSNEKLHERQRKKYFISICCYACNSWDACSLGNSVAFWSRSLTAVKGQGKLMAEQEVCCSVLLLSPRRDWRARLAAGGTPSQTCRAVPGSRRFE